MLHPLVTLICVLLSIGPLMSQEGPVTTQDPTSTTPSTTPSITQKTAGMRKIEGFQPFYWDADAEKVWFEVGAWDTEFLHVISHAAGVAGRDRGSWAEQRVLVFQRVGAKVFLIHRRYDYRADTSDLLEQRAVVDAYTDPIIAGFAVAAEEGGRVLIDATDFLMSEGVRGNVDRKRSALSWPRTKGFPRNTEIELLLTTPDGGRSDGATTVRLHHSWVALPGPGYRPRRSDPRAGVNAVTFVDYAQPIDAPIRRRFIHRHRLQKKDPAAAVSEAVEPIVYYLDPAAPEPIRSALVEGASWWNEAFEAIGFQDAFQVKVLPAEADPMDLRYNMILWTHRPQRGWSIGTSVHDPRTGEIITGRVFLGSQRVRQDFLIGSGLVAAYGDDLTAKQRILDMVLARTRQLAAHEVGHTLGFAHNFAASTCGDASVMDYPHPDVKIAGNGDLDLAEAYHVGIGEWDKVSVAYAYTVFADGDDEDAGLDLILSEAQRKGLFFLGTVGAGSASPRTSQWDNGADALVELERVMNVRAIALSRLGEQNIPVGAPLASLAEVLVPIYMFHRYQVEAASKSIGGVDYRIAVRGDGQVPWQMVPAPTQRRALDAVLRTIEPVNLVLPEALLGLLCPSVSFGGERFRGRTAPVFDPLAAAEAATQHTVGLLLDPRRAGRLIAQHAQEPTAPGLGELLDRLLGATWMSKRRFMASYALEVGRTVDSVVVEQLMRLAADTSASAQVRAIANLKLEQLRGWLASETRGSLDDEVRAHYEFAIDRIRHFRDDPQQFALSTPPDVPAGAPIGMGEGPPPVVSRCGW